MDFVVSDDDNWMLRQSANADILESASAEGGGGVENEREGRRWRGTVDGVRRGDGEYLH